MAVLISQLPYLVNMSVGNPRNEALNAAAAALVSTGVFVAVAAHNFGKDAYNYSPGSEPTVCTVGASTPWDSVASVRSHSFFPSSTPIPRYGDNEMNNIAKLFTIRIVL